MTPAIREDLVERGQLGASITNRYVSLQRTEAQKRDLSNFCGGQVLLMQRVGRGMEKHEALVVDRVEAGFLVARNAQGGREDLHFSPNAGVFRSRGKAN